MLEAILAMPGEEGRMRSLSFARGRHRLAGAVDDRLHAGQVVDLPRDHDVEIVRQTDQPPIEHPVRRARQRQLSIASVSEQILPTAQTFVQRNITQTNTLPVPTCYAIQAAQIESVRPML